MNAEELAFLVEIDEIRRLAGMPKLDEVSRREFMKKAGAGAAAGAAAAAVPGGAEAWTKTSAGFSIPDNEEEIYQNITEAVQLLSLFEALADYVHTALKQHIVTQNPTKVVDEIDTWIQEKLSKTRGISEISAGLGAAQGDLKSYWEGVPYEPLKPLKPLK